MILRLAYLQQKEKKLQRGIHIIKLAEELTGKKQEGEEAVQKELRKVQEDIEKILSDIKNGL